jgi:hypothetical protein
MLINVAILGDRNVVNKEAENILKYKGLKTEIRHMWNVKTKVIPVTKEATGTMPKLFIKYLNNIPEKYKTTKNCQIGHCTHSSERTNVRVENIFNMQNNITRGTNCKYRAAVILYIP